MGETYSKVNRLEGEKFMTNQQGEQFWYPQLPDGYEGGQNQWQYAQPQQMPPFQFQPQFDWSSSLMNDRFYQPQQGGMPHYGQQSAFMFPFPQTPFPNFPTHSSSSFQFPGANQQAPMAPPPDWTPQYPSAQARAIDPGAIVNCMFRMTYIWTSRNRGFWFFPTFVGPQSIAGFRWNERRRRWQFTGLDLQTVETFTCL